MSTPQQQELNNTPKRCQKVYIMGFKNFKSGNSNVKVKKNIKFVLNVHLCFSKNV